MPPTSPGTALLLAAGLAAVAISALTAGPATAQGDPARPPTRSPQRPADTLSGTTGTASPREGRAPAKGEAHDGNTAEGAEEARRAVERLASAQARERDEAARALRRLGEAARPVLETELKRLEDITQRLRAVLSEIAPSSAPRAAREAWYEAKFREAAAHIERGDPLVAWKLLDAILVLEPDCAIRDRIEALRVRARERLVRATVIEGLLVPKKVLLAPGEPLELAIMLRNVAGEPLEFAEEGPSRKTLGVLEVETFSATLQGERARRRELREVRVSLPARLAIRESCSTPLVLPALERLPHRVFRRVTVSGSIRPAGLFRGDERFSGALPLFPVELVVIDPSLHALAADPLGALRAAIAAARAAADPHAAAEADERIFFAALLAPASDRPYVFELLRSALEHEADAAAPAAIAALATLTDRPLGDRQGWLEWLRAR